jgi:hypothetical protein
LGGNPGQRHRQSASLTKGRGGMDVWLFTLRGLVEASVIDAGRTSALKPAHNLELATLRSIVLQSMINARHIDTKLSLFGLSRRGHILVPLFAQLRRAFCLRCRYLHALNHHRWRPDNLLHGRKKQRSDQPTASKLASKKLCHSEHIELKSPPVQLFRQVFEDL